MKTPDFSNKQPKIGANIQSVAVETGVPEMTTYFRWLKLVNNVTYIRSIKKVA